MAFLAKNNYVTQFWRENSIRDFRLVEQLFGDFGEEDHSRIERFQIDLLHVDLITCADFHATIRIVKQILFEDH